MLKRIVAVAFLLVLVSCGGRDFLRPAPEALKLGLTRYEQMVATFGEPKRTGLATLNGVEVRTATYLYGSVGPLGTSFSTRQMVCVFDQGLLVSYDYASLFDEDRRPVDEAVIKRVKQGDDKAEVVAALGQPTGEAVYPVVPARGNSLFRYTFLETTKIPFVPKPKETRRVATVSFDVIGKELEVRLVETKSD